MNEHTPMYVTKDGMGIATRPNRKRADVANVCHHADESVMLDRAAFIALACNAHDDLLAALRDAKERMDRTRHVLTKGKPSPTANWGMLETSDLDSAIAKATEEPWK